MTTHPRTIAMLLGGLALLGPLSVDAYLPAFDNIRHSLHTDTQHVQYTLSAYLFSFAAMSLWHGALADALGRRKVILASLVLFGIASLGCALATDVGWLSGFRTLQGVAAGAGTVVGRAMVRDLYEGAPAARMLSLVSMIFSLSPALAPVLGGWIVTAFAWRAVCGVPRAAAAHAAVDGDADLLLCVRHVAGGTGIDLVCAGSVSGHPGRGGVDAGVHDGDAGSRGDGGDRTGAGAFLAMAGDGAASAGHGRPGAVAADAEAARAASRCGMSVA
jgi:MFS family permease